MKHSSTSYIGITTKMERYCARFALILEVLRYTCGQSDLTSVFTTREGLTIALQHSMSERTFKDWIKTAIFKKLDYGTYEKRHK